MKMLQIFAREDALRDYKLKKVKAFGAIYFFEDQVNGVVDMSSGHINELNVNEKILTDGNISLSRINRYAPQVIWHDRLQTLDNGSSIAIEIDGATYMVCAITFGDKIAYEIHVTEESQELYDKILAYLFANNHVINPNLVFFRSPKEIVLNNSKQKVLLNLKTGTERVLK